MNRRVSKYCNSVSEGNRVRTIASILAAVVFALSGCSSPRHYWYNPEKTLREARLDCRECYSQAVEQAAEDVAYEHDMYSTEVHEEPYSSSRDKDSERIDLKPLWESTQWGETHRENIFRGCMSSRGYALTREKDLDSTIRKSSLRAGKVAGK